MEFPKINNNIYTACMTYIISFNLHNNYEVIWLFLHFAHKETAAHNSITFA